MFGWGAYGVETSFQNSNGFDDVRIITVYSSILLLKNGK